MICIRRIMKRTETCGSFCADANSHRVITPTTFALRSCKQCALVTEDASRRLDLEKRLGTFDGFNIQTTVVFKALHSNRCIQRVAFKVWSTNYLNLRFEMLSKGCELRSFLTIHALISPNCNIDRRRPVVSLPNQWLNGRSSSGWTRRAATAHRKSTQRETSEKTWWISKLKIAHNSCSFTSIKFGRLASLMRRLLAALESDGIMFALCSLFIKAPNLGELK